MVDPPPKFQRHYLSSDVVITRDQGRRRVLLNL